MCYNDVTAVFKVRMVKGPATVSVDGTCHVLGSDVSGQTIRIRTGMALPFEPRGRCRLRVRLGRGGKRWLADHTKAETSLWPDLAKQFPSLPVDRKVKVILPGNPNRGKPTIPSYLENVTPSQGLVPSLFAGHMGKVYFGRR